MFAGFRSQAAPSPNVDFRLLCVSDRYAHSSSDRYTKGVQASMAAPGLTSPSAVALAPLNA
jgi:hypothetical protein